MSEDDKKVYDRLSTSMEVLAESVDKFNTTINSLTEKGERKNSKDENEKGSNAGKILQYTIITGASILGVVIIVKGIRLLIHKVSDRN